MFDLYNEVLKSERTPMTPAQLMQLKEAYAYMIVDDMDVKTLMQMAIDTITENLQFYTAEELQEEIVDLYDEEVLSNLISEAMEE